MYLRLEVTRVIVSDTKVDDEYKEHPAEPHLEGKTPRENCRFVERCVIITIEINKNSVLTFSRENKSLLKRKAHKAFVNKQGHVSS